MRGVLALLVVVGLTGAAYAVTIDRAPAADARIDSGSPDTNYGGDVGSCCSGKDSQALLFAWDLSDLAGWTATSDGTFNLTVYWKEGDLCLCLYELIGGPFDEMTVTYNNYGADLGAISGDMVDTSCDSGDLTLSVPQQTIQDMIDGTVDGLVTRNCPDEYWNHCQATRERDWQLPHLVFDAVPEPVTLSVLALGGLLALRRKR